MVVRVTCNCGHSQEISSAIEGETFTCPGCNKLLTVIAPPPDELKTSGSPGSTTTPAELMPLPLDVHQAEVSSLSTSDPDPRNVAGSGAKGPAAGTSVANGRICPSCGTQFPTDAKTCAACGIDLTTGGSLLVFETGRADAACNTARKIISVISWVFWIGLFPLASEAFGTCKPYVIRGIAVITLLTSVWFWVYEWSDSPKMQSLKNLWLWGGHVPPDPMQLFRIYLHTRWGDDKAFFAEFTRVANEQEHDSAKDNRSVEGRFEDAVLAAHNSLSPEQRCVGQFHWWQVITSVFLHAEPLHLVGNLFFLMFFGSRVNALIGNIRSLILYPILAIAGSIAHMLSMSGEPPSVALGASGAIMGLAAAYLVLFPLHKVHMAAWIRPVLVFRFNLRLKIFAIGSFWVVLFYVSFDVLYTILRLKDGVAHWAHLGGFIAGVCLAILLLVTRLVKARGRDLLSVILGRRAWALIR